MIKINFDNEDHFCDITEEGEGIEYNEEEQLSGHMFRHIAYGIFAANPPFYADEKELQGLRKAYPDIAFIIQSEESIHGVPKCGEIAFAYSERYDDRLDKRNYLSYVLREGTDERFARYKRNGKDCLLKQLLSADAYELYLEEKEHW